MKRLFHTLALCIVAALLSVMTSCGPSLPDGVLSSKEMEDVLFDFHIAQALYETREFHSTESDIVALRANVLKKHGLTQQEWDNSMSYYCQHADELHRIYININDRVERNVIALGGKSQGVQGEEADTANVWKGSPDILLMQQTPYNILSYDITPDSTFQDGDNVSLQCDTKFIFQDGYKSLSIIMVVTFSNDSISTMMTNISRDGHGIVTLNNEKDRLHIKNIKGFFMLGRNLDAVTTKPTTTTLRLVSVRNIKLLHLHTTPPPPPTPAPEPADSTKTDSVSPPQVIQN